MNRAESCKSFPHSCTRISLWGFVHSVQSTAENHPTLFFNKEAPTRRGCSELALAEPAFRGALRGLDNWSKTFQKLLSLNRVQFGENTATSSQQQQPESEHYGPSQRAQKSTST